MHSNRVIGALETPASCGGTACAQAPTGYAVILSVKTCRCVPKTHGSNAVFVSFCEVVDLHTSAHLSVALRVFVRIRSNSVLGALRDTTSLPRSLICTTGVYTYGGLHVVL